MMNSFASQREQLISTLRSEGIYDPNVLATLARIPRELFVDEQLQHAAYENCALPLSLGQTISQPFIVALMTQALSLMGQERVLEVGTGSGYQTAILASLAGHIYSVERHAPLSEQAEQRLAQLGLTNVSLLVGDGSIGWMEEAPYDRIIVTAAAPHVPLALVSQLKINGLLEVPIGNHEHQELEIVRRVSETDIVRTSLGRCVFVPLIGDEGWSE